MTPVGAEDTAPVREGEQLDWTALDHYLRSRMPELAGTFEVLQFPHGSANLSYRVRIGERLLVVRRPPFGTIAPGAHDMKREYTTLAALSSYFDRAPRAYLYCDDDSVIGAPFIVVEHRDGVVVRDHLPDAIALHERVGWRIGIAIVDALAELHLLDPVAVGLGELGRPAGFAQRQVGGWRKRWDLVETGRLPTMADTGRRLEDTGPFDSAGPPGRVAIVHNDYKVDNCQFVAGDPDRVASVFDWDMTTLGDPLFDVGTLLSYWPDPDDSPRDRAMYPDGLEAVGLPSRNEILRHYAARTGFDIDAIGWYEAFATWRITVATEQLYQRHVRGESRDERMVKFGARAPELAARAARLAAELPRTGRGDRG